MLELLPYPFGGATKAGVCEEGEAAATSAAEHWVRPKEFRRWYTKKVKPRFLAAGLIVALVPALWVAQWIVTKNRPQERPNVLMFLTDDQPSQSLSVMPKTTAWFGRSSTRFTNSFVTTPLCCPSRASIFTGRYSHNHGVWTNSEVQQVADLDQRTTFQYQLGKAGYRTALFGKYLNAWDVARDPPFFDEWAIFSHSSTANYGQEEWNVDNEITTVEGYSSDLMGGRAEHLIRER